MNQETYRSRAHRSCPKISELRAEIRLRATIYLVISFVKRVVKPMASKYTATVYIFYECPYAIIYCFFQCYGPNSNIKKDQTVSASGFSATPAHTSNTFCRTLMCAGVQMREIATNFCTATLSHKHFYTQLQNNLLAHSKFEKGNYFLSRLF